MNEGTATDHRYIHATDGLLHRALGGHSLGPHGKLHAREVGDVAHAGVDDEAAYTARHERAREQVAEVAHVAERGGRHDENVAGLALFHGHMQHPVVAGGNAGSDGRAADVRAWIDGAQVGRQQTRAALRFVDGGDAVGRETVGDGAVGAGDVAVDDAHKKTSRAQH